MLGLPYQPAAPGRGPDLDLDAPGLAVIGYSRAQALAERAMLPVTFGAIDGEASWLEGGRIAGDSPRVGPHRLGAGSVRITTRPALFTALRTGFARDLLSRPSSPRSALRAPARADGITRPASRPGLGKLLVVAPIRRRAGYLATAGLDAGRAGRARRPARDLRPGRRPRGARRVPASAPEPVVLVMMAMAYEGLDAPEVAVVAALTLSARGPGWAHPRRAPGRSACGLLR